MSRTHLEEAVARDLRDQATGAPTGEAVVIRVRALTAAPDRRRPGRFLPVYAVVAVVVVIVGGVLVAGWLGGPSPVASLLSPQSGPVPACHLTDLSVTVHGGPGHPAQSVVIRFRNVGAQGCELSGYPVVELPDSYTQPQDALSGPLGGLTGSDVPPRVWLPPGAVASSMIESDMQGLPDDYVCGGTEHLLISLVEADRPVSLRGLVIACNDEVHPFVPGPTGSLAQQ